MKGIIIFYLIANNLFAIFIGEEFVQRAAAYIGYPYISGEPENKWYGGLKGDDGYYWYGVLFNPNLTPTGFDCSGLVSWCAGLRRHYTVSELYNFCGLGRSEF